MNSTIYIAQPEDFKEVLEVFKQNRKYLGHVRDTKLKSLLEKQQIVFENGVVITFHISKINSKIGRDTNVDVKKGDCVLHHICSLNTGGGHGTKVLKRFFDHIDTDVYLSVREENESAIRFYEKVGMERVGYINWSGGKAKGYVYKFSKKALDLTEAA